MGFRFQDIYFDLVYAPVYDCTVARIAPYRRFLEESAGRLRLRDGSTVLSIGVGTGNEILHLTKQVAKHATAAGVSVVAVDLSRRSLCRARRKSKEHGNRLEILKMDAHHLAFSDQQFDAVMCLHTMDFIQDPVAVTREIFRVLRKGGEFVITYPTGRGNKGLATDICGSIAGNLRRGRFLRATGEAVATLGGAIAYAPLALSLFGRQPRLTLSSVESLIASFSVEDFTITEDPAYLDIVVLGKR